MVQGLNSVLWRNKQIFVAVPELINSGFSYLIFHCTYNCICPVFLEFQFLEMVYEHSVSSTADILISFPKTRLN